MKAVVIGEASGAGMEEIMKVYPRHKVVVDKFIARGLVVGIGPFSDLGNMAIFKTRAAAEEFTKEDPFILEGLLKSFTIRDWNDSLLPE
ncbi:MAG: hypothetical protein M3O46_01735 [Myxococcota bacterium]|nr:hypothetical protein [Myxococcota bacterium]